MVGERTQVSDLEESCTVDRVDQASARRPMRDNSSLASIYDGLAYGFELSWFRVLCGECERTYGYCSLEGNQITIFLNHIYIYILLNHSPRRSVSMNPPRNPGRSSSTGLALGFFLTLRFVFGIPYLIGLLVYKWKTRHPSMNESETIEELQRQQVNFMPINYTYGEIKKMTSNFRAKLGGGPHGTVFNGNLLSGPFVAVKMLINSSVSDKEFISHVSTLSRISHPNFVKLIGFCIEGTKRALEGMNPSLSYGSMFKISLGIARGIAYLHGIQIFHLGIKPQNILLDEDFNPKISDSGLAKLYSSDDHRVEALKAAKGKMGFIAPELFYRNIGEISSKADVYSFGMLVLEMAARLQSLNPYANRSGQMYFPSWIYNQLSEGKDLEIRDAEEEEKRMVKKMIVVGLWCIQIRPGDRPLMNEVVVMLEGEIELLHMPPMPFHRAMDDEIMEKSF
ncbi:hypothetical protein Pfo_027872 [Paulownia fortunei]|nr:hypothetical protein Pfo_027872 [Paulownia fortunei]